MSYDLGYTFYDESLLSLLGLSIGIIIVSLIISLIACVIIIVSLWKVFKKAGKEGWEAIVPIYNIIVLFEICEIPLVQIILMFIPFANIYIMFKLYIELAKKFGKDTGFGVLTAFFPYVCLPILAFSDAQYNGNSSSKEKTTSILDVNEVGVPNNSESSDFSYGYEKEETVVMDPVEETENKEE